MHHTWARREPTDYVTLACLLALIATIGGALGSGLEGDAVATEATYGFGSGNALRTH